MDFDISKFRDQFIKEAKDILYKIEVFLSALKTEPENNEIIKNTYRAFHTIKGTSAMYGFEILSEYSETLESIYKAIFNAEFQLTREIIKITYLSTAHMKNLLADNKLVEEENIKQHNFIKSEIDKILSALNIDFVKNTNVVHYEIFDKEDENIDRATEKTYHILINLEKDFSKTGIKLENIYKELGLKGKYKIFNKYNAESVKAGNIDQIIAVFLVTLSKIEEIEYVFLFLDDETTITEICDFNIFDTSVNLSELAFSSQLLISEKLLTYTEGNKSVSTPK